MGNEIFGSDYACNRSYGYRISKKYSQFQDQHGIKSHEIMQLIIGINKNQTPEIPNP
ncbi:hypothetical protein GCM10027284_27640 [Cyclobacterium sediminis]